jgi:hypothetical protein
VPAALFGAIEAPTIFLVVMVTALGLLGGWLLCGAQVTWNAAGENALAAVLVAIASPVLAQHTFEVVPVLIVTSTTFVRWARTRSGVVLRPVVGRQDRVVSARSTYVGACLGSMSGRELCQAWRASFPRVKSDDPRDRRVQAGVRNSLLDELERRDADRFRAWLSRSPSAASDPLWVLSLTSSSGDEPVG